MTDTLDDQLTTAANKPANLSDIDVVRLHVLSWLPKNRREVAVAYRFYDP
ncbi:MAG: hypothetical protein WCH01_11645 [Methylococcaceae bacterium]